MNDEDSGIMRFDDILLECFKNTLKILLIYLEVGSEGR